MTTTHQRVNLTFPISLLEKLEKHEAKYGPINKSKLLTQLLEAWINQQGNIDSTRSETQTYITNWCNFKATE